MRIRLDLKKGDDEETIEGDFELYTFIKDVERYFAEEWTGNVVAFDEFYFGADVTGLPLDELMRFIEWLNDRESTDHFDAVADYVHENLTSPSIEEAMDLFDEVVYDRLIIEGNESDTDLGFGVVEMLGGLNELDPMTLRRYFDYDAFGRDLRLSGDYVYHNDAWISEK